MARFSLPTEEATKAVEMGAKYFLFIASDYKPRPGGIATYVDNLARGLRSLGHKVKILAVKLCAVWGRMFAVFWRRPLFLGLHRTRLRGWKGS